MVLLGFQERYTDAYPYYEIPTRNKYAEDTEEQCEDPPNICPYNDQTPSRYYKQSLYLNDDELSKTSMSYRSGVHLASSLDDLSFDEDDRELPTDSNQYLHQLKEKFSKISEEDLKRQLSILGSSNNSEHSMQLRQINSMARRYPQCPIDDAVWYHTVILISLDGFHPRYLKYNMTPVLDELIRDGATAEAMLPTFPTYTFPNHMTLLTGLYPETHGIINNEFCDPALEKCFTKKTMMDPCWYKADPLWNTVQDFGIKSAAVYWIGSEVCINGRRPNYVVPYTRSCGGLSYRINQLVKWLDLPTAIRPTFLSCYISIMDDVGHANGPNSEKIPMALKELDESLAVLINGLKTKKVDEKVSIVIVSDHGMQSTGPEYFTYFDDLVPFDRVKELTVGPVAFIRANSQEDVEYLYNLLKEKEMLAKINGRPLPFVTYRKGELVDKFHFGSDDRVSDLVLISDPHHQITLKAIKWTPVGLHGYPLPNEDMDALFIVKSPHLKQEYPKKLPRFSNLDLYPFLCSLLNVTGNPCNGSNYLADQLLL
jgi:predicted AlkP superfamily pyrophosphatase or phosphodiesterase